MSSKAKQPFKIVEVVWLDSEHHADWEGLSKVLEEQESVSLGCRSVGYLIADKEDRVILSTSYTSEESEEAQVSYYITIPKIAVLDIKELRVKSPAKKKIGIQEQP